MRLDTSRLLIDPDQQLRYGYARNNPLRWSDPNGLEIGDEDPGYEGSTEQAEAESNAAGQSDEQAEENEEIGCSGCDESRSNEVAKIVTQIKKNTKLPDGIRKSATNAKISFNPNLDAYGRWSKSFDSSVTIEIGPQNWSSPNADELLDSILHELQHDQPTNNTHGEQPGTQEWEDFHNAVRDNVDKCR